MSAKMKSQWVWQIKCNEYRLVFKRYWANLYLERLGHRQKIAQQMPSWIRRRCWHRLWNKQTLYLVRKVCGYRTSMTNTCTDVVLINASISQRAAVLPVSSAPQNSYNLWHPRATTASMYDCVRFDQCENKDDEVRKFDCGLVVFATTK